MPASAGPQEKRHASPQAWRRVRGALGPGEASDIAQDIAAVAGGNPEAIMDALLNVDWDSRRQA